MASNIHIVPWCPLQLWNSCRIIGTMEHGAIVTSWFKSWMSCCFCRMPVAEIATVLEIFCYYNRIAKLFFTINVPFLFSTEYITIQGVYFTCIYLCNVMYFVNFQLFGSSTGSLYTYSFLALIQHLLRCCCCSLNKQKLYYNLPTP